MSVVKEKKGRIRRALVVLILLLLLYGLSSVTRSLGLHPIFDCPEQTLSTSEVQALYERGLEITKRDMRGEYYMTSSIDEGLPLLKEAARHGHREAMDAYGGHFVRMGGIEMMSFDGLSAPDATAEGMMWSILGVHLGDEVQPFDKETYRVLLDPEIPFPDGFFDSASGTAWLFQMLSDPGLNWARRQAHAWRRCWAKGTTSAGQ